MCAKHIIDYRPGKRRENTDDKAVNVASEAGVHRRTIQKNVQKRRGIAEYSSRADNKYSGSEEEG